MCCDFISFFFPEKKKKKKKRRKKKKTSYVLGCKTCRSGDVGNSWAGISSLQALFIKEHYKDCDASKEDLLYCLYNT
jgi:hypothetical protein